MISEQGEGLVFLLGVPRSGTTLLATMLGQHPHIVSPPEPWLLLALEAVGRTPFSHPADPQLIGEAFAKFASDEARIDAARAYALSLYNSVLSQNGKSVFVDKTPRYYLILPFLTKLFPRAKYLWLRRNPLDVAASFKSTWQIDLPADLQNEASNRGCMDLVLGPRMLAEFADAKNPAVHEIGYEALVAEPQKQIGEVLSFLGLETSGDLSHFDLGNSELAKSDFGDRKIMATNEPHAQSVGKWGAAFDRIQLQTLTDAVGVSLFQRLGYESSLSRLAELGVTLPSAEVTAIAQRKVQARYAERLLDTQAITSLRGNGLPGSSPGDLASLFSNPVVSLAVQVNDWQRQIVELRKQTESLKQQASAAQAAELAKTEELAGTHSRMHGLEADLAEANDNLRRLREQLASGTPSMTKTSVSASVENAGGPAVHAPDVVRAPGEDRSHQSSWSSVAGFINDEHAGIYEATKNLPGWQDPPDSFKLYEMGYQSGEIILEIGVYGGRSAVVELTAALRAANEQGRARPQFYGVDLDINAIPRSLKSLRDAKVESNCLLYHGTLKDFRRDIPIVPTMVFVDGDHSYEGVLADLSLLSTFVAPGTPIMCHDYGGIPGVKRGIDEAIATGFFELMGLFAGSAFLRATTRCTGVPRGLKHRTFEQIRDNLLQRYQAPDITETSGVDHAANRAITFPARQELRIGSDIPGSSGKGHWPFVASASQPLPATLPDGRPWPKISVVTPTLNQGKFIEKTILSVLNQQYPNLQYIVMDGGSIDETLSILARYADRVHVVSEKDSGQSNAINKGFKLATGELMTWLNSDDMLAPDALAGMAMAFYTSEADIVAGVCQIEKDGQVLNRHITTCGDGPLPLDLLLDLDGSWMQGQFFYQPEVMFTRQLWDRAGGRVDESLHYSMDYELWLRFAEHGAKLHPIGRTIALFGVHPNQKTHRVEDFLPELRKVRDGFLARTGRAAPKPRATPTKTQLRVVFFNDLGWVVGAGIAHHRMAMALASAGCEVVSVAVSPDVLPARITSDQIVAAIAEHAPDVVVIGNLHGASLSPSVVAAISSRWPAIQVVHDLWMLTGRCAYNGDCQKFVEGCDESCPTPHEYPALAPSKIRAAWEAKQQIINDARSPILAGLSRFTGEMIKARFAHLAQPGTNKLADLRCGLPQECFIAPDQRAARHWLGLPQDKFIILFSASNLSDKRKGLPRLLEALQRLALPDTLAVCIGHMDAGASAPGVSVRSLGYLSDPGELAMVYAAADLFVSPSEMETFGQTFIEAAACGTPSVAFPVGGIPEALAHGISGKLASANTAAALAEAIESLHQSPALRQSTSIWGKLWAENEWSLRSAAQRFISQLNSLGLLAAIGVPPRTGFAHEPASVAQPIYLDMQNPNRFAPQSNGGPMVQARLARLEAERDQLQARVRQITGTRLWRMVTTIYPTYYRTLHAPFVPSWFRNTIQKAVAGSLGNSGNAPHGKNGTGKALAEAPPAGDPNRKARGN